MTTSPASHYTYRVSWSAEDDEFVATCLEFPSLSWLAGSQQDALAGLTDLVQEVVADLTTGGEAVPEPLGDRAFSGRFNLRLDPALHRSLAMRAAEHKMSLNQYIAQKLSHAS